MKGVLAWLVCSARCAGTRDFFPASVSLVGPVQNIFFLAVYYFSSFVPIDQQAGQAVVPGRLSLNVYLCFHILHNVYKTLHTVQCTYGILYSVYATV
jgi:hypothetical protein